MYDPATGNRINTLVLSGFSYIQPLNKYANSQFKVRTSGSIDKRTHQPVSSRIHDGGSRMGYMERDALLQSGSYHALVDRFFNNADQVHLFFCETCQSMAFLDYGSNQPLCVVCKNTNVQQEHAYQTAVSVYNYIKAVHHRTCVDNGSDLPRRATCQHQELLKNQPIQPTDQIPRFKPVKTVFINILITHILKLLGIDTKFGIEQRKDSLRSVPVAPNSGSISFTEEDMLQLANSTYIQTLIQSCHSET
jgi:hypothetical protein